MSAHDMPKLVKMANQIATFFESQTGDQTAEIAAHLSDNWSPQMRRDFLALLDHADLHPQARAASAQMRQPA